MAGDSFFQKERKRKRPSSSTNNHASSSTSGPSTNGPHKRSRTNNPRPTTAYGKGKRPSRDEELSTDSEPDNANGRFVDVDDLDLTHDHGLNTKEYDSGEEEELNRNETAGEKRIRLAKGYLQRVREEVGAREGAGEGDGTFDAAEVDRDIIAARLKQDVDEQSGAIHTYLQNSLSALISSTTSSRPTPTPHPTPSSFKRHFLPALHSNPITSSHASLTHLYISNKHGSVIRYSLRTMSPSGGIFGQAGHAGREKVTGHVKKGVLRGTDPAVAGERDKEGHKGEIVCVAASEDGKYVVTGGKDKLVGIWESISIPPLSNTSHHILTSSLSRNLCLHSISTLSLIDTFFGHQDSIASVSAIKPTAAVTTGGRDRTARWWKVEEEVQLVFRGGGRTNEKKVEKDGEGEEKGEVVAAKVNGVAKGKGKDDRKAARGQEFYEGSVDVCCILDDSHFLTGGDSGSISLWHTGKKKPIFTAPLAHGIAVTNSESEGTIKKARWITSLAALRGTDLFASGSSSGEIKLWALTPGIKSFVPLTNVPARGFVNSLQLIAVPPSNVQPQKWGDREKRQREKYHKIADKKERRAMRKEERKENEALGERMQIDGEDKGDEGQGEQDEEVGSDDEAGSSKVNGVNGLTNGDDHSDSEEESDDEADETATSSRKVNGVQKDKTKLEPEILLIASLSREPRLGRWEIFKASDIRNGTLLVHLGKQASNALRN